MHPKITEWLSEFDAPNTKREYLRRINKFLDDNKLTVENLEKMSTDEIKHVMLKWRANLLTNGTPQNSVLSYINGVRSFLSQINKPIKFRTGALGKVQADNDSHVFSNGDLKTLFEIGDTTEKAILATACSLGWEISAFLTLEKDKISRQIAHAKANNEQFIFFEDTRPKTGESRLAILNPLAITWLSKYLETSKSDSEKLFDYTADGIHKMVNSLAVKSGLKTTGAIRFHNIRKWLMSRLSRCGFGEFQIKYILGKAIPISDRTYLQTLKTEVEEKYPKVYNDYLNIVPEIHSNKEELKKLSELEIKLNNMKTEMDKKYLHADLVSYALISTFKKRNLLPEDFNAEEFLSEWKQQEEEEQPQLDEEKAEDN